MLPKEDFLHVVWQLQYFNAPALKTVSGEPITILHAGMLNTNAGPDFSEAVIRIGEIQWAGQIEMHVTASDWYRHQHDQDSAYENVILHVVWNADCIVKRADGSEIPTISIKNSVPLSLLEQYITLQNSTYKIPCRDSLPNVPRLTLLSMLDATLSSRLERKASEILAMQQENKGDWEQTAYQVLCRNLGFKVNADPFEALAKELPLKILQKHADQPIQVEALLFGQAGFLEGNFEDSYLIKLQAEHTFLQKKYRLEESQLTLHRWKFLRMRPANFPTVRLAQLAALVQSRHFLFSTVLQSDDVRTIQSYFQRIPTPYWQTHYYPEKPSKRTIGALGKQSLDNLLINTVAPLLMAVGIYQQNEGLKQRATQLLEHVKPETNKFTKLWEAEGVSLNSAFDTQAALELMQQYCLKKRCMYCKIGAKLLSQQQR